MGMTHIYTGDGKGKTTAALGLGIRACGRGFKVLMIQFLKGADTGEIHTLDRLGSDFVIKRGSEIRKFTWQMSPEELEEARNEQKALFDYALQEATKGIWQLIILDEVMAAVTTGMIKVQAVEHFLKNKPEELELVLTGRNAPEILIGLADYVSEIKAVKHPIDKGIPARTGIES